MGHYLAQVSAYTHASSAAPQSVRIMSASRHEAVLFKRFV